MNETTNSITIETLDSIAFLYSAQCKIDGAITKPEWEPLAKLIFQWGEAFDKNTLISICDKALKELKNNQEQFEALLARHCQNLKKTLDKKDLKKIIEELKKLSNADGIYSNQEKEIIDTIIKVWGLDEVDMNEENEGASTLGDNKQKREIIKALAKLYLWIAASDSKYLDVEQLTIKEKLSEWELGVNQEEVENIISETLEYLKSLKSKDGWQLKIKESLETIKKYLDEDSKIMILRDLISIAISDGNLANDERNIIVALAENWDLPDKDNVDKYIQEVMLDMAKQTPDDFLRKQGLSDEEIESLKIQEEDSSEMKDEVDNSFEKKLAEVDEDPQTTFFRSLTTIYLILANLPDKKTSKIEMDTIISKLNEWVPELDREFIGDFLNQLKKKINFDNYISTLMDLSEFINKYYDDKMKANIIKDLLDIAASDSKITSSEVQFIRTAQGVLHLASKRKAWLLEYLILGFSTDTNSEFSKCGFQLDEDDGNIYDKEANIVENFINLAKSGFEELNSELENLTKQISEPIDDENKELLISPTTEWSVIHDILVLLIYIGSQSINNLREEEWDLISSNITKFKFDNKNSISDVSDYDNETVATLCNFVSDTMNGDGTDDQRPLNFFNQSLENIMNYYIKKELDNSNIYNIVKLMFDVSMADDDINEYQKGLLEHTIKLFIHAIPELQKINDLIYLKMSNQKLKGNLIQGNPDILDDGGLKLNQKTGKMKFTLPTFKESEADLPTEKIAKVNKKGSPSKTKPANKKQSPKSKSSQTKLPDEIIAEVYKKGKNFGAKIEGTDKDITKLIDNIPKLKYAYERSGFIIGKKDSDGTYKWRAKS